MKKLTTTERMRRLIKNHNDYLAAINLNFANQFYTLAKELELEQMKGGNKKWTYQQPIGEEK